MRMQEHYLVLGIVAQWDGEVVPSLAVSVYAEVSRAAASVGFEALAGVWLLAVAAVVIG